MVNNSDTKVSYKGNGQTTVFPFSFPFIQRDYIKVAIYDSLTDETKTIDSDYYVDTVANAVIYPGYEPGQEPVESLRPPILPATSTITIYRQTDVDQLTDLGEKYPLKDIENMADKLTEIIQEQDETLGRAVKVPVGDPKTPEEKLTDLQNYVSDAANSAKNAATSEASAQRAAEAAATSEANAAESERIAGGYADTATAAAGRAEDSAISARAYNAPDYDNAKTYQAGDVVTYTDGNSYRALQETTGNEPPNIIYWQKVTDYVGDDFFEVDEYGYIVPMDSQSHSRYWRVDQNGYIVPIEGGDGGYRPDTRSLSAEYLNVTNEGYVKHLRADDISAQDFSATGNVTAGMVTTPQANVTTLTANAVNAGTLTADDIIAKGPIVDVRAFGAVGDGVHDDTAAIQAALDSGKKIILDGVFRITAPLNINNAVNINGTIPKKGISNVYPISRILVDLDTDGTGIIVDVLRGTKIAIRDLSIAKKTDNLHTINAIKFNKNVSDSVFENIVIGYSTNSGYGFEKGIVFDDTCWSLDFKDISIYNCNAIGIEANNITGAVFKRLDIFDTPIGIKSTNSTIIINQGDFDKNHIGVDVYGGYIYIENMGAENYSSTDGGLEKAYIRSDGTANVYIKSPTIYNNGEDTYNLVSVANGTWEKPIIIDNYHYNDVNRFGINIDSSCEYGCVKFVNLTTEISLPKEFRSPYVCFNGVYSPIYMPDSTFFPGVLACTLVGHLAKKYKGYLEKDVGDIVFFSTAQEIQGTIKHISSSGVETIGVINGVCYPSPSSFTAVSSDSNKKLTISATTGYFDIDILIKSGYATPSDYPVY